MPAFNGRASASEITRRETPVASTRRSALDAPSGDLVSPGSSESVKCQISAGVSSAAICFAASTAAAGSSSIGRNSTPRSIAEGAAVGRPACTTWGRYHRRRARWAPIPAWSRASPPSGPSPRRTGFSGCLARRHRRRAVKQHDHASRRCAPGREDEPGQREDRRTRISSVSRNESQRFRRRNQALSWCSRASDVKKSSVLTRTTRLFRRKKYRATGMGRAIATEGTAG